MKRVTKIKLIVRQDQADALHRVMFAYSQVCNFVTQYAFRTRVFSNFSLNHALYSTIRLKFRLPAQLAVSDKRDIALCRFKKHSAIVWPAAMPAMPM